jgi:hypothetical protein
MIEVKLPSKKTLPLTPVAKGLWSVEDACGGEYDFFELSPVYQKRVRRGVRQAEDKKVEAR